MQLTMRTDYALRVLLLLVHRGTDADVEPMPVARLSEALGMARDHAVKVVQELSRRGWVSTRAGRLGGALATPVAADLTVAEVVEAIEGRPGVLACLLAPETCVLEPGCGLRRLLARAEQSFYDVLAEQTLGQLASPRPPRGGLHNLSSSLLDPHSR